ncbi:MAG TPA: hypothetical protein VLT79_02890 [Gemmatimonadales bacterium]|nr:hypothetical protein [Gemmatimonadales bacterium]
MVRSLWAAVRATAVISILLGGAAGSLSAQQVQQPASQTPSVLTREVGVGPQLIPTWPRYEAPTGIRPLRAAAADLNDQHTVVLSTLSLVLIGVIVVLLAAR